MNSTIEIYTFHLGTVSKKSNNRIIPIFLPFEGCPHRCIFCAQDKQTGIKHGYKNISLSDTLANLFNTLKKEKNIFFQENVNKEIAFYGGTFTLLPTKMLQLCLDMVKRCYTEGLISRARCSTRPDALTPSVLTKLKESGIQLVELGVQSFSNVALNLVRRGYTKELIIEACHNIASVGLEYGIQLLPGMPGSTPDIFLEDVTSAIDLNPSCLRFYPCLVVDGTELATIWRQGFYHPWDIPTTVNTIGKALAKTWDTTIPVIRLSLAPEPELDKAVLAGPRHPALGSMIQGEALVYTILEKIKDFGIPTTIRLPSFCRGFFYGHRGALKERWIAMGINPFAIQWTNHEYGEFLFV